jgi:hypothetical protein
MRVSRKWLEWAHGPGAEDGQPLATRLCELANTPGNGAVDVTDPALIAEVVDVAECYRNPSLGDALYDRGPWWRSQPSKIIASGKAELRALERTAPSNQVISS